LLPGTSVALDLEHPEVAARQIEVFARRFPIATIVPVDDGGTLAAAWASERLGLPHNPTDAVAATRNKALLRRCLAEAGIPSPEYRVVNITDIAAGLDQTISFPCVVKPLSLSGSRGVIRANDAGELQAAIERIRSILTQPESLAECGDAAPEVLVESYIPGDEVAVEGLLTDGTLHVLAIFDKPDPLVGPFFEETIYVTPSRLSSELQKDVIDIAARSAAALGLRDGPLHAELRLNERGAFPVDVAARSIGGLCSRTLSFGTGMSLEEIILRHAVGAEIPSFDRQHSASGVMMIPIPKRGVLRGVRGVEAATAVSGIESVTISIHRGQPVVPLPEGSEYLGFIFARGGTPAEVESALRRSHSVLAFDIDERA
ncbi:MAG: ATP-grasp domain-containing protein, partial [Dehalococcoidia bacterium]